MQEEVENRTLTLVVSGTKFTGRLLKAAVTKYMAHLKEKKLQKQKSRDAPVIPHGKQTVKELIGQNQGVSNIEITDPSIKEFEKIARKYGVDYAVKKDCSCSPPKYLIFFKGRDADALTAAFTEYTGKKVKKTEKRAKRRSNPELRYGISSNRNRPPISLSPKRNGSRSDDCPEPQAGGAGKLPGITGGAGADRAENVPAGDSQPGSLSAKDGAGRLCGEAGIAGAEGACFPFAPEQQQLKSAHAPGA